MSLLLSLIACGGGDLYSQGSLSTALTAGDDPAPAGTWTLDGSEDLSEATAFEDTGTLCDGAAGQSAGWVQDLRADAWPAYTLRFCAPVTLDDAPMAEAELDVYLRLSAPPPEGEVWTFTEAGAELAWELQYDDADLDETRWGGRVALPTAGLEELLADSTVEITGPGSGNLSLPEVPFEWREGCSSAVEDCDGSVSLSMDWDVE